MSAQKTAIGAALFALESVAHLQGKERDLLPLVEAARAENEQLRPALEDISAYVGSDATADAAHARVVARAALQVRS